MLAIDTSLIVVFLIVWLLVAVLSKFFFKPIRRIMEERNTKIDENRKKADLSLAGFEQTFRQIEEKLKVARTEAQTLREKLEQKGLKKKGQILEETYRECRGQVEEAKKKLNKQLESLRKELESRSVELAERIEQRLLRW